MPEPVIQLDRSKPFSECRGERTPDDPHYRVHFFQVYKVGRDSIQLPFDGIGELVPDDGKVAPYPGTVDGKPIVFHPLYNEKMRDLVVKLKRKLAEKGPQAELEEDAEPEIAGKSDPGAGIDLIAWLKGKTKYRPAQVQEAIKAKWFVNATTREEMARFLVLDQKLVPANQVCTDLQKYLTTDAAA